MPNKQIALISLYDEYCLGVRSLAAYLTREGFVSYIINFKRHRVMPRNKAPIDVGSGYLTEVTPVGELYLCYPQPMSNKEMRLLLQLLSDIDPLVVGISVPSYYAGVAQELTTQIKTAKHKYVIWGGVHAIMVPEDCFQRGADFVCVGEGEEALTELVRLIYQGENPATIDLPGIWRRGNGDEIIRTPIRPLIADLDSLPFPQYDPAREFLIDDDRIYHRQPLTDSQIYWYYKIFSSRGCPYQCSFCLYSAVNERMAEWRRLRRRSVDSVIAEIQQIKRANPQMAMIEFEDDIFTINKKWLTEFAEKYPHAVGLPFWCYTHPKTCDKEMLELLKSAGIEYITMGIESGSDRINYEIFNRKVKREESLRAAELIYSSNIPANYDVITNNPFETEEDRLQTLDLLASIPGEYNLHLGKLAFFPGTSLWHRVKQEGINVSVDENLYRLWNALYLLAMFEPKSKSSLFLLSENTALRNNPQPLWDLLLTLAHQREKINSNYSLSKRVKFLEQELTALKNKKLVKAAVKVTDLLKTLMAKNVDNVKE